MPSPDTLDAEKARARSPKGCVDPWHSLAKFTDARIALGRAGASQRTETLLDFRLDHARARDAVHRRFHAGAFADALGEIGFETLGLSTRAEDRRAYLLQPNLGRTLDPASAAELAKASVAWGRRDLAIIVSDGLSALAVERHAAPVLAHLAPLLRSAGWTLFPLFIAPYGRVKLQDEVGEILGARHSLMLLGERPGLGSPDSLGAYFTFLPRADRTDADRNCVSNIRNGGLAPDAAAQKLSHLLCASARLALSGVWLKDTLASLELPA